MSKTTLIARRRAQARASGDPEYLQRRQELNEAAIIVFRKKGYRAATLQDVANEMGVDRASLYYYVAGKEELYRDIVTEAVLDNVHMVEKLRYESGPADKKIADLIAGLMASYQRHYPYLFLFVQEDMSQVDREAEWGRSVIELSRRFDENIRGLLQQGIDDGILTSHGGDARLLANAIIGMCNWSYRWFHPQKVDSSKSVSDVFSALVLKGLLKTS